MCDVYTWFIAWSCERQRGMNEIKAFARTLGLNAVFAVIGEQG